MSDVNILSFITFVYFVSFLLYLVMMVMGKTSFGRIATIVTLAGLAGHTAGIILRWIQSYRLGIGHAPLSNLYESLIFFAWTVILLYCLVEWRTKNKSIGVFITPIAFLAMAYASYSPSINSRIQPLVPALQSNWFIPHVIVYMLSYAILGMSWFVAILGIIPRIKTKWNNKELVIADNLVYIGFGFLTLGLVFGAFWAKEAWGHYWTWDPKETWAMITWMAYLLYIHYRLKHKKESNNC